MFADSRARRVVLPTYAFQRQRYWRDTATVAGDAVSLGLVSADHPLMGAVVASPESGGVLVTGRLSLQAQPWLADHAIGGVVLLPGTGFVELVVRAGDEVGCPVIRELTLVAPLVLPREGRVQVQVLVGGIDDSGERVVSVHSRTDDTDAMWVLHAQGVLVSETGEIPVEFGWGQWPPLGAVEVDVDGAYDILAETLHGYGPVFQGLQSVWRRGEDLFVQAALPETGGDVDRFGLHPALLDAVLHALVIEPSRSQGPALPFVWEQVRLYTAGASVVRARLTPTGSGGVGIEVADESGHPVLSVQSLTLRPVSLDQLAAAGRTDRLHAVSWTAISTPTAPDPVPHIRWGELTGDITAPVIVLDTDDLHIGEDGVVARAHALTQAVLAVLQAFLSDHRFASSTLLVVTHGAVATTGEQITDLAASAVWGLVRSAQSEDPGRIVLTDTDTDTD
ncbi:polyketide synthase dehydratase domain-containing protein, partial [Nocardia asteroides]|uniref:polyketide synthase dehydratase domain-containing protein n=1 Tax=Nocardia asteroides TaxID=1824 RepID=UPI003429C134